MSQRPSGRVPTYYYRDATQSAVHSAEGLQRNLDNISATYKSAGLLVNVKKTEVMTQPPQRGAHSAHPFFRLTLYRMGY